MRRTVIGARDLGAARGGAHRRGVVPAAELGANGHRDGAETPGRGNAGGGTAGGSRDRRWAESLEGMC